MLETITATSAPAPTVTRWHVDRDEYGPLGGRGGGLFQAPVVPSAFVAEPEEAGRRPGTWVPDGLLL
jgi:hypothetical protein